MSQHIRLKAVVLAVVVVLALGTAAGATTAGGAAKAASGPIKVDIVMTLSGAQGAPFPGLQDGTKARIERLNRSGGIGGRKVQIVHVLDDAGSPSTNSDQIHKAVEQDKVEALFLTSNVTTKATTDYLKTQGIPMFGWVYLPWYCDNTLAFGWAGCSDGRPKTSSVGAASAALIKKVLKKDPSKITVAVQSADDQASAGSLTGVVQQFQSIGSKVVFTDTSISGSTQTTDYSPYVQRLLASKPDLVYVAMNFQNVVGFTGALIGAGYTGPVENGVGYLPGVISKTPDIAKGLNGSYIYNSVPAQEEGTPAIKQMQKDMKAIKKPTSLTLGVSVGYWSADVFAQMAQKLGKDFSAANIDKLGNETGFTTVQSPGGACPVTFPADHTKGAGGAGIDKLVDGKYKIVVKYTCWAL